MPRASIISRLTASGAAAALFALLLWPFLERSDTLFWPLLALLGATSLAGAAILLLTALDMLRRPRRGSRVGPIRIFDLVAGAALLGFGLMQLHWLAGRLPA